MRVIFLLAFISVLFSFCSKNNDTTNSYIGTWELRSVAGGMLGGTYPEGSGNKLVITNDSMYFFRANNLSHKQAYQLIKDTLNESGPPRIADRIVGEKFAGFATFLELKNDTLKMYDGVFAADGTISSYIRIK